MGLMADIINDNLDRSQRYKQRDGLQNRLEIIYNFAPQTTTVTVKEAQCRLNPKGTVEGEDFTFTDEEIDMFMPETIRISNIKTTTSNKLDEQLIYSNTVSGCAHCVTENCKSLSQMMNELKKAVTSI